MAREMAVVLASMRPERKESSFVLSRWAWGILIGALIAILVGTGLILWISTDWRGLILGAFWVAFVGGGAIGTWRLWQGTRAYKESVQLQAREEILRVEGRYKALVQYASDVFLILSREGAVSYASPSIQRALGYTPEQIEGSPLRELLHPEDRALIEGALARQSSAFFTVRVQHREGYWRYFEAVGQPLFSDPIIKGYLLTVRDITDRYREEAQRKEKEAIALRLAVERERAEYEKNLIEQSRKQLEEAYRIIEQKNHEIEESFQYAARIQRGMLASVEEIRKYFPDSFVFWQPRDIVSGDFYWFLPTEGWIYFAAADCTGHGVPGALMTMISSAVLTQAVLGEGLRYPDEILSAVHRMIRRALRQDTPEGKSEDGMDIALTAYSLKEKKLFYAGANRPLWIAVSGEADLIEYRADRKGIGGASAPSEHFFTLQLVDVPEGSWIYASSDGFADQFGGTEGRKYMGKRFKRFLHQISGLSAGAQHEALQAELASWKGEYPQVDDILVIGFRV